MSKQLCSGFTLVMVLVFLQLASMLALYELLRASQVLRMLRATHLQDQGLSAAKNMLTEIALEFIPETLACNVPLRTMRKSYQAQKQWWLQHACIKTEGEIKYYFVYETLGVDPCGYINNIDNNQSFAAIYYRITLYAEPLNVKSSGAFILQSTLAKSSRERLSCLSIHLQHEVYSGLQMMRLLTGLRNIAWH